MPSLRNAQVVGTYSGLRPSTEHRDYQIASDRARRWITVGGIRSTGLTASSGIGEHVALLLAAQLGRAADDVATLKNTHLHSTDREIVCSCQSIVTRAQNDGIKLVVRHCQPQL